MEKDLLVFLIDDDHDDQQFFALAASRLNRPVTCRFADECREALDILAGSGFHPDFIFVDLNMPLMNGLQCLGEIRKIERFKETPVYLYTTSSDERFTEKCLALGATGVFKKASSIEEIKRKLAQILFP